ncbi:MAG: hypothetical protein JWQ84_3481 [Mucilaginibacter sp.]|nr:hypothetical protein [Mucilaginibacter sp.]MDB5140618.1 hypothetical protein [Mucilaginibacter sp.]
MTMEVINWLEKHMLPCAYKSIFGIDCPGCGFQRSFIALLKGDLRESLLLYPATIPVLIMCAFLLFDIKYRLNNHHTIKNILYISVVAIIIVSYSIKLWGYAHYKASA